MKKIHKLYTIPEQNQSLPDIAHLYTLFDFRELTQNFTNKDFSSMDGLDSSFSACFEDMAG